MPGYFGDLRLGDTIDIKFCTVSTTGAPTTLAGSPAVSAYPGNSTTEITAGITLSVDFDSRTGMHNIRVVASGGNGYATATNYALIITAGTVGGTSVVGYEVGSFSIENRSALMPTTAGRTLDVSAGGEAGVDWANVGSPTTTLGLSGTTVKTATDVEAKLPAALVGGRMDSSTGAMAANVVTAAAVADGAIDRATFAADTGLQSARSNTAQAGANGSITLDASASATTDFYVGMLVYLTGATGVGQARVITAYDGTTKVATIAPNWATNPDATSTFAILDFGNITGVRGNVTGSVGSVTGAVGSVGTGGIGSASFAANAVDAAALGQDAAREVADEILNRNIAGGGSGGTRIVRDALRILRNKRSIAAGTLTVYAEDDSTTGWTAAVSTSAGNPISEVDPA